MTANQGTAPRWITEAIDAAYDNGPGDCKLATALIERLPLEAMRQAAQDALDDVADNRPAERHAAIATTAIVKLLSDGDPEVVELTELYQNACKALDAAGVPYAVNTAEVYRPLDLAGRIRWLAEQRPTRLQLDGAVASAEGYRTALVETARKLKQAESERESFRADAIHARAIAEVIGKRDATIKSLTAERDHLVKTLAEARAAAARQVGR